MVMALAGRRIDRTDAVHARFPAANTELVRGRLRSMFSKLHPGALVSSAACGADLLALDEAGALGIRRRVVLPFDSRQFRRTSVVDRPGEWGSLYDRVIAEVGASGDLVILQCKANGDEAYAAINSALLDEAAELASASDGEVTAALVWDQQPRAGGDLTKSFGETARRRGWPVVEVPTV
jgi:hypothetical protein